MLPLDRYLCKQVLFRGLFLPPPLNSAQQPHEGGFISILIFHIMKRVLEVLNNLLQFQSWEVAEQRLDPLSV